METNISPSIIMRVREFGESDLLVYFFTQDRGRLKGIAKGARKSRKRFVNCLDIFSLVNLEYSIKRKSDLYFIQSGKLIDAYPGLRTDFAVLSKASYMIELTEVLFPWELPDQGIFEILKRSFELLAKGRGGDIIPIVFELMAMSMGGYGINLAKCCICGREYLNQGIAVYIPDRGGIACLSCQPISAVSPKLSPEAVKTIKRIQTQSYILLNNFNCADHIIAEIKPVLKLHREYHLGKRLRTANYSE
jgi:DNA repair protein RecO (recombination protein O)